MTLRAVGRNSRRCPSGPTELPTWRERFARELRRLGIEAEATLRQARGVVHKAARSPIYQSERRGRTPQVRRKEQREAEQNARALQLVQRRDWSRDIQARQESICRAYLEYADYLATSDAPAGQQPCSLQRSSPSLSQQLPLGEPTRKLPGR